MKSMDPKRLSSNGKKLFEKIEFDNKERLLAEIRKHPFGLILRYASGLFITLMLSVIFFIMPLYAPELDAARAILGLLGIIIVTLAVIVTLISGYLYESNVLIVTSDKLAQVLNNSILSTKISQLSIGDVQDVTVVQAGLFSKLFNYGTITIETAGEQTNLIYTYTPDPFNKSKIIVASHEENLHLHGN